ncbi:MAG TPA: polysaccharide deacetylase family protein, partial [Herpetosiphonaceae bacterium]
TPEPTATATPEPTPAGLSEADLARIKPNEMGWVLVLEYHLIEEPDAQYSRSPAGVRSDLEWLHKNNFYPITFRDLANGAIDIPAGKSPVVLTFDDSSDGQFRYLPDGKVDPTSAMGIMQAFAAENPDFPAVGVFFPLIDVDVPERVLFGQPEEATRKLKEIVELGGEVGSHTYTHLRLDLADADQIQWQLAFSTKELEERIGDGYKVTSLSLPLGMYPEDESLLEKGESEGVKYAFAAAAEVAGGASPSPFSRNFNRYHIRRTQAVASELDYWFPLFEERPELKFTSDGDPSVVTIPSEETLPEEQQGLLGDSLPDGLTLRRYERK